TETGFQLKLDKNQVFTERYPEMAQVFACDFMRQVADSFLGKPNSLNRHIILTHDFKPADQIFPFHFDEMNALKFYIYLTSTTRDTAPLEIIPKTQSASKFIRMVEWQRIDKFSDIRNCVFDEFSEEYFYNIFGKFKQLLLSDSVTLDGLAGT